MRGPKGTILDSTVNGNSMPGWGESKCCSLNYATRATVCRNYIYICVLGVMKYLVNLMGLCTMDSWDPR
jgi:hypothetical protein